MSNLVITKKITIGGINGIRAGFKGIKELTLVARIYGTTSKFDAKESAQYGVSYKFSGEFRAINADGEEFASPVCYLVEPAQSMLVEALNAAEGKAVEFAFDFFVQPDEKSVTGYIYEIKPLLETKASAPLQSMAEKLPQLSIQPRQVPLIGNGKTPEELANESEEKPGEEAKPEETAKPATSKKK